jgi:hypothetical protein
MSVAVGTDKGYDSFQDERVTVLSRFKGWCSEQ